MNTYALTVTEFGVNITDQDGKNLSSDDIKALAEKLLQMVEPQPIASLYMTNGVPDQLVLFDGKKRKKPEKTEDEKRVTQRTKELIVLIAKLRNLNSQQLALSMDDLMVFLPGVDGTKNINHGKEGVGAKKIAQSGDWTDRQIVACYKWLKTSKDFHLKRFADIPLSLQTIHEYLPEYNNRCQAIQSRKLANTAIEQQRQAAYKSIEMDVSF